jgi:hypothetical protein
MPESNSRYLHQQHITEQSKYAYFLLAAAASAIALAVKGTASSALAVNQAPLGLAVVCWSLSFYFGCRHVRYVAATLYANINLVMVQDSTHPQLPPHPQLAQAAAEGVRKAAERNSEAAGRNAKRQFKLLVAGAVLYIAWHVLGMALRTPTVAVGLPLWLR